MKRSTKTLFLAMSAVGVVGLAGCSAEAPPADPNGEVTGSISVIAVDGFLEDLAAAFEEKHPGTTVDIQVIGDISANQQTIRTQLTSGTGPDVFSVFPGNGTPTAVQVLAGAGDFMMELSNREWVDEPAPGLIESGSVDGSLYTALFNSNGIGMILDDAAVSGLGLATPSTFPEVLQFCADAREAGTVAFAVGGADSWTTQMTDYALAASLVYGPDPEFAQRHLDGDENFGDSRWADALDLQVQMIDAGCYQDDALGVGADASLELIAGGEALGTIQGSFMFPALKDLAPDTAFTLHPFPATDDPSETFMPIGAAAGYSVSTRSDNPATALAFVDFLMSPEGITLASAASGAIPAYPVDTLPASPATASVVQFLADGRTAPFPDQLWPNARVQAEHLAGLQELYGGRVTAAELLADMQSAFDQGS